MSNILQTIRRSRISKAVSLTLALSLLSEMVFPTVAWALTSGPSQPEYNSFTPVETTEMVDLYSGDFSYNIPLLSVPGPNGGYPVNLGYTSNIGMDEEASWVGLGWNINVGAINRNLRGLPDDFKGKIIEEEVHIKPDWTVGIDFPRKGSGELFGFPIPEATGPNMSIYYNSYKGIGYSISQQIPNQKGGLLGANVSHDSQDGINISPQLNLMEKFKKSPVTFAFGANINSRAGFQGFSFSSGLNFTLPLQKKAEQSKDSKRMDQKYNSTLSFTPNYNSPSASIPLINKRFDIDFKLPPNAKTKPLVFFTYSYGILCAANVYYEVTKVANGGAISTPAFGYLHTSEATDNGFKDYSRSPMPYSKEVPYLSTSMPTYDLFVINGQGTGGMFRPHLSNNGIFTQPYKKTEQDGHRFNLEVPIPQPPLYVGAGYCNRNGHTSSGRWRSNGDYQNLSNNINYEAAPAGENDEPYYFKAYGEKTSDLITEDIGGTEYNQYDLWSGNNSVHTTLERDNGQFKLTGNMVGVDFAQGLTKRIDERVSRGMSIKTLTKAQASQYDFNKDYTFESGPYTIGVSDICDNGCEDDIFEIQVLQPDGTTYIYGLPAYNWTQVEATFSVDANTKVSGTTNRVNLPNGKYYDGANQYYSKKTIPEYAHSWMLTGIIGPDYVDRTNDGISDDDFGYWVRFNYERKYSDYRWRAPYTNANYIEGSKNDNSRDDIGSYLYGEKDVYYLESIETKTHTAVFTVSDDRDDAKGASGELATTTGTQSQFKLTDIKLYTRIAYDADPANAIPLKTVEFRYHDDLDTPTPALCNGVENSSGGKLTLKELYFKYNGSEKGSLSPYKFDYEETNSLHNPNYNNENIDRWGNYKYNQSSPGANVTANYPFHEFPYTNQWDYDGDGDEDPNDVAMRHAHASAWHLKKITLPTGGIIQVDYEQDDYAYVENKPALQMFDIVGVGNSLLDPALRGQFHPDDDLNGVPAGSKIYIKLPESLPVAGMTAYEAAVYFKKYYLKELQDIYFKALVSLPKDGTEKSQNKDYVTGYARIYNPPIDNLPSDLNNYMGLLDPSGSGNYEYGYFTVLSEQVKLKNILTNSFVHPFRKAAWYYTRGTRPDLLSSAPPEHSDPFDQVIGFLYSAIDLIKYDIPMLYGGYENYCVLKGFSRSIKLNGHSIVRLNNPQSKKYGGGSRVKRITLNDAWASMNPSSGGSDSEYGQEYDYTIIEDGRTISSGVAYEPSTGGEESALKQPIRYVNSLLFKTDEHLFLETPILEEFYPSPSVGYSKVTVKSLGRDYTHAGNIQSDESYAPYTVHEYYTAKEFPIITHSTQIDNDNTIRRPIILPVYSQNILRKAVVQGFSVILNDMPGKLKSVSKFTTPNPAPTRLKDSNLLYKEEYIYKTTEAYTPNDNKKTYELDCKVSTVMPDGTYKPAYMGQSHDFYVELHEDFFITKTKGVDLNFMGPFGPIPVLPIPIPNFSKGENSLKTAVTHKIIYKTGIVDKVIVTDEKASIETQNLAFDALTGQPVLTRTTNEFKDPVYALNYPAHWYYEGMGGAYQNIGYKVEGKQNSGGNIQLTSPESAHFVVGDEVWVTSDAIGENPALYNVYSKNDVANTLTLLDKDGKFITLAGNLKLEVIRSGHRNLLSAPAGSTVMQQVSYTTGTTGNLLTGINESNKIINTSAVEYGDDWQLLCGGVNAIEGTTQTICRYSNAARELFGNVFQNKILPHIGASHTTGWFPLCASNPPVPAIIPSNCCVPGVRFDLDYSISNNTMYLTTNGCLYQYFMTASINAAHNWMDVSNVYLPAAPLGTVTNTTSLTFYYVMNNSTTIYTGSLTTNCLSGNRNTVQFITECFPFYECEEVTTTAFEICSAGDHFNPYKHAVKGVWRPTKSYAYHHERDYSTNNVRTDGHYSGFAPFNWQVPSLNDPKRWVCANTITKISPYSSELENRDALGIYSSALYGYDNTLVTAVAANARYQEIAFDGFEDYEFDIDPNLCGSGHWDFRAIDNFNTAYLSNEQAHTGLYSCKLTPSNRYVNISSDVIPADYCSQFDPDNYVLTNTEGYIGSACQCIGKHALIQGRKYILSAWVKGSGLIGYASTNPAIVNKDKFSALVTFYNNNGQSISNKTVEVTLGHINGWSKLEGAFDVPNNATKASFTFQIPRPTNGLSINHDFYLDDIRIQPFNSEMKTFVYHPLNLRLLAELDGQNYATFYIYDEEGNLVKINKETINGIRTLTESRMHTVPTNTAP